MECSELQATTEATRALIVCVASSFSWWSLLTPAVVAISALAAAWGVVQARATARKRATLDLIEKFESTDHYRGLHAIFMYHRRSDSFERLHNPREEKDRTERQAVLDYLNHYELVAIGILNGILDEEFYRTWMKGPFVRDWNAAATFIQRERWKQADGADDFVYYRRLFENFQQVACAWGRAAVRLTAESGGRPLRPEGPGDEHLPGDPA